MESGAAGEAAGRSERSRASGLARRSSRGAPAAGESPEQGAGALGRPGGLCERRRQRLLQSSILDLAALMRRVGRRVVLAAAMDPANHAVLVDQERDGGPVASGIAVEPVAIEGGPIAVEGDGAAEAELLRHG